MKSLFIWLLAVIVGGVSGFGVSYLFGISIYLSIFGGIILGSSVGFTINIHRDGEEAFPADKTPQRQEINAQENEKISQKVS